MCIMIQNTSCKNESTHLIYNACRSLFLGFSVFFFSQFQQADRFPSIFLCNNVSLYFGINKSSLLLFIFLLLFLFFVLHSLCVLPPVHVLPLGDVLLLLVVDLSLELGDAAAQAVHVQADGGPGIYHVI